jgi:hypothetical protein
VTLSEKQGDAEPLNEVGHKVFISVAGKGICLVPDRFDAAYIIKEVARRARAPTHKDLRVIRNLVRYLKDTENMATQFRKTDGVIDTIDVYVDSDWTGELVDRRRTSSAAPVINGCLMH